MNRDMHPEQRKLIWDSLIGFFGFLTVLTYLQAILNVFSPDPAIWPGFVAAGFTINLWLLFHAKKKSLRQHNTESFDAS